MAVVYRDPDTGRFVSREDYAGGRGEAETVKYEHERREERTLPQVPQDFDEVDYEDYPEGLDAEEDDPYGLA